MMTGSNARYLCVLAALAIPLAGCGAPPPHARDSAPALARAVLEAVESSDVDALRNLALGEQDFREHVWPELPAARAERKLPFSYVWGDLHQKSETMLRQMLAAHGGRHYELHDIQFLAGTTPYDSYVVHRESELLVRDGMGKERRLRLFGSVLEKDGRFKIFSYVVD
jgi:hypothetical protein